MTVRPGDWTQLDIARAIAREALDALREVAPERYAKMVRIATAEPLCQSWVRPRAGEVTPGERISTRAASELLHIPEATIRAWASNPQVPVWRQYGGFDPQELLAHKASKVRQDQDRAALAAQLGEKYTAGATIAELAEEIGRSGGYVVTLLREADVTLRRRGHR